MKFEFCIILAPINNLSVLRPDELVNIFVAITMIKTLNVV